MDERNENHHILWNGSIWCTRLLSTDIKEKKKVATMCFCIANSLLCSQTGTLGTSPHRENTYKRLLCVSLLPLIRTAKRAYFKCRPPLCQPNPPNVLLSAEQVLPSEACKLALTQLPQRGQLLSCCASPLGRLQEEGTAAQPDLSAIVTVNILFAD